MGICPAWLVCSTRPHPKVERVVGVGFQPGLQPAKVVSASQAGDIQFLDMRNLKEAYLTIDAHSGSLTSLAVHRHAPLIASGSSKQLIKVFNLEGEQLGTIRYLSTFMAQKIGSVRCLTFHPIKCCLLRVQQMLVFLSILMRFPHRHYNFIGSSQILRLRNKIFRTWVCFYEMVSDGWIADISSGPSLHLLIQ